jgi:transcriptional regulator with XRE-family HTH domain
MSVAYVMLARMQLVDLRRAARKSLADVAEDLGTTPSTVNRHERGLTPMSGYHRTTYGLYFGVKADSIEQPARKPKRKPQSKTKRATAKTATKTQKRRAA